MKNIVKYKNDMNKLNFHGLRKNDMNLFMAICSKVKEKGEIAVEPKKLQSKVKSETTTKTKKVESKAKSAKATEGSKTAQKTTATKNAEAKVAKPKTTAQKTAKTTTKNKTGKGGNK